MTEEKTNNQSPDPDEGQSDEGLAEAEEYDKLSNEELEKLVKTGEKPAPVKPAEPQVKEGEPPTEPPTKAPTEELPDDLKGKSAEELAKAYLNIRKLHAKQDEELGNLRKFKEEAAELDNQMKQMHIDATSRKLIETDVKAMTDAEKEDFYNDPVSAIMKYVSKAIKPIAVITARQTNENEIRKLIEDKKDDLVPFDRKAVDKILASFNNAEGRNKLFDLHGSKAFEEAYKIDRDRKLPAALEKREKEFQEKALKEAEEQAKKKVSTYTESQGVTSAPSGSTDYEHMPMEELERLVGKPKD